MSSQIVDDTQGHVATPTEERGAQSRPEAQKMTSAPSLSELTLYVEQAIRNREDIRKARIRVNNRLKALQNFGITHNQFYEDSLIAQLESFEDMENRATRMIERTMKQHPLAQWVQKECPGIGLDSVATILNATGPLNLYPNPAKVWKVLGLAVYASGDNGEGEAPDKRKFARQKPFFNNRKQRESDPHYSGSDYNLKAHGACFVLGGCIEKQKQGAKYKDILLARKAHTAETRAEWTPIHRRYDANRIAVKAFVKDLWVKWHEMGLEAERIRLVIEDGEAYERNEALPVIEQ